MPMIKILIISIVLIAATHIPATGLEDLGSLASTNALNNLIGMEIRISDVGDPGDSRYKAYSPKVAYNSVNDEYLVVWWGTDTVGGLDLAEVEVFGQRVNASSGMEIGNNDFRISDMGGTGNTMYGAWGVDVAYNSTDNEYFVVWWGTDNEGGLVTGEIEIFGQRLDFEGVQIGVNDFRISDMGVDGDSTYSALVPTIAYNGVDNEYLVVWYGDDNVGGRVDEEMEIFGQLIDAATGAEIGVNDFRISDMGGAGDPLYVGILPHAAFNSVENEYLVVWCGDDNLGGLVEEEYEIFGQRLASDGSEIGSNDFRISDMAGTGVANYFGVQPTVVYNPERNEFFVVWTGDDATGAMVDDEYEIFGQFLDAGGAEIGANDFQISTIGALGSAEYEAIWPRVAYKTSTGEYLVTWHGDDNAGDLIDDEIEVFGQFIDAETYSLVGEDDFQISFSGSAGNTDYFGTFADVVSRTAGDDFFVVWEASDILGTEPDFFNEYEIIGQLVASIAVFSDGFESTDTSQWSMTVP